MLEVCGLQELRTIGEFYTWAGQRHSHSVQTKIDRAFATADWLDQFPTAYVQLLLWLGSDHRPLLLHTDKGKARSFKVFRYDNRWKYEPEVKKAVKAVWEQDCKEFNGDNFHQALIFCRKGLSRWKSKSIRNSHRKIQQLKDKLHSAYNTLPLNFQYIGDLKSKLSHEYKMEEEYWRIRSKAHWARTEDRNTKYFYMKTKQRRALNRITVLEDEDGTAYFDGKHIEITWSQASFLQSKGASTSELTEIVSTVPEISGKKEGESISVYYDCVKEIVEDDKSSKYKNLCLSSPQRQENKIRNVLVLRELGMPQRLLFPLLISNLNSVSGKERFEESLKKVVEMGFDPTTSSFVKALNFVYAMSENTIEEKVNVYKRLGFAESDVWEIFKKWPVLLGLSEKNIMNSIETFLGLGFSRDEFVMMVKRFPQCIGYSAKMVKKKTEFLVKKMNWPLSVLISNPVVLGLSMEKRILPRCNVIKALISKGLTELPSVSLVPIDETFLKRYARKHDGDKELVAELMAIFTGKEERK